MKKHYHLIGIGGIGMGTLASLLMAKGHKVTGSDIKESDYVAQLRSNGAKIKIGHDASNVEQPDYVVYSSAIRVANPELIQANSKNIPLLKRAQVLAQLANEEIPITVAGAHGKTTTTSMISYLLINAGLKPTTAVGGIINGSAYNAHLGEGKYFVAEVDESDGTFLYFRPQYAVITNIDFEHVDHYKNWDGILNAYAKFIGHIRQSGFLIACGEDQRLMDLANKAHCHVMRYGFNSKFDCFAEEVITQGFNSSFICRTQEGSLGRFELAVPGKHNVLNALACICIALRLGINMDTVKKTLKEFTGVKRRFQLKGDVEGIRVIDDYGHHPTEIAATLNAARSFEPKRLLTVFQPHRYSRTKFLLHEFVDSLKDCEQVVLTDIYAASEKESEGVSTTVLFNEMKSVMGNRVTYLPKEKIVDFVCQTAISGDMVVFLGAGDIYQFASRAVDALKARKVKV